QLTLLSLFSLLPCIILACLPMRGNDGSGIPAAQSCTLPPYYTQQQCIDSNLPNNQICVPPISMGTKLKCPNDWIINLVVGFGLFDPPPIEDVSAVCDVMKDEWIFTLMPGVEKTLAELEDKYYVICSNRNKFGD
ncbi:hypothetical protein PFISCL1PPCAC_5050, partial [Pristionchus fissidentatus]